MILFLITRILFAIACIYFSRFLYLLLSRKLAYPKNYYPQTILITLGSGGHTGEMLFLLNQLKLQKFKQIYFLRAKTDPISEKRVQDYLNKQQNYNEIKKSIKWLIIPRAREVKQSYLTSIFTTLYSLIYTYLLFFRISKIDLLITNGPGTIVPVAYSLLFNKVANYNQFIFEQQLLLLNPTVKMIFIESFCRVQTLSLTGKLLYRIANKFIVQWPELQEKYPRAQYLGPLL